MKKGDFLDYFETLVIGVVVGVGALLITIPLFYIIIKIVATLRE